MEKETKSEENHIDEKRGKENYKMKNEARLKLKIGGMYGEPFCVEESKKYLSLNEFRMSKKRNNDFKR